MPRPDLVEGGQVATRRGRHVDQHLGPVEGQQLGHAEVPEVLADAQPDADSQPRRRRPEEIAGGEEAALVEQAVGRQEELALDVANRPVLEQGDCDEQAVIGRLLDERDDRRQPVGGRRRPARAGVDRRAAWRPRRRGPAGDSRSGRARGRRPGRHRRLGPARSGRDGRPRLSSSRPSRGAIWARAIRRGCTGRV